MEEHIVSFYITSFPSLISQVWLRKELEVCDILTNIYVSGYRNSKGDPFGFARFMNVKDSLKLKKKLLITCVLDNGNCLRVRRDMIAFMVLM